MDKYYTAYNYRYTLDLTKNFKNSFGSFEVYHYGKKLNVENPTIEFVIPADKGPITKEEFYKIVEGTVGINNIEGEFKEENNKYYTPDISEFFVGFEYEENGLLIDNKRQWYPKTFKWEKVWLQPDWASVNLLGLINNKKIRVKYLDKDDIESLGFTYIGIDTYGYALYSLTIYSNALPEKSSGNIIRISHNTHSNIIWLSRQQFGSWGNETDTFPFKIKNKSELKRLLKQLNIN